MEYIRCALVECSFAAFAEGPGQREAEKSQEGRRKSPVSERAGRRKRRAEEEERTGGTRTGERGFGGPVRLVNERPRRRRRATLLENKAGFSP